MKRLDEVSIEEMERNCRLQIMRTDLISVIKPEKREEVLLKYQKFERREKRKNQNDYSNSSISRFGSVSRFLLGGKKNSNDERDIVTQFLIENEEDIDKGKVLLITLKKYLDGQDTLNDRNHPLHNINMQGKKSIEDALARTEAMAEDILKDENIVISRLAYKPIKNQYLVEVITSKELADKKTFLGARKRERESQKVIHALPNEALLTAVLIANESIADKDIYVIPRLGIDVMNAT